MLLISRIVTINQILDDFKNILWIISNQVHFEELQQQILSYGFSDQCIVRYRYIDHFRDMYYLLTLDEKYYDDEIVQITGIEFVNEIPDDVERKRYILQIINTIN